jgi:hypothetical protein
LLIDEKSRLAYWLIARVLNINCKYKWTSLIVHVCTYWKRNKFFVLFVLSRLSAFGMRTLVFFLCFFVTCSVCFDIFDEDQNHVVAAIQSLLKEYFVKSCPKLDFLVVGESNGFAETVANELLRSMSGHISVTLSTEDPLTMFSQTSTIILIDSMQHFNALNESSPMFLDRQGVWFKHLVYAPGLTSDDVIKKFPGDESTSKVGFLVSSNNLSIELATTFWFTPQACNTNQIMTINRYSRDSRRWVNSTFYPNKYQNFHGCPVQVFYDLENTNIVATRIFATLSDTFNYETIRTDVKIAPDPNSDYYLNEVIVMQDESNTIQALSSAIFFDPLTFVVPPGEPLTDLERMFAAFDKETWISIGATFGIALVVIQVINCCSTTLQNFVYGRGVRTPTLNLFSIFLTGGQNRVPGRNFARFHLMLFVIWSLIFRTCYQSMSFQHMSSDMRHPRVKTIEELKDKNFTLVYRQSEIVWVQEYSSRYAAFGT